MREKVASDFYSYNQKRYLGVEALESFRKAIYDVIGEINSMTEVSNGESNGERSAARGEEQRDDNGIRRFQ